MEEMSFLATSRTLRFCFPLVLLVSSAFIILSLVNLGTSPDNTDKKQEIVQTKKFHFKLHQRNNSKTKMDFLKTANLLEFSIPDVIEENIIKQVTVNTFYINVLDVHTFYQEAEPPFDIEPRNQSVLLLHGANFNSETWLKLHTIHLLAALGYRVVAVDLPGYGQSAGSSTDDKGTYLKELISTLSLANVVIVSPSMSGAFSIPFMKKHFASIDGYVPVSPVSTNEIVKEAPQITTPTLIVYGQLDTGLGYTSLTHLTHLPNSISYELEDARHPAYLDQPRVFHTLIYNFLKLIKRHVLDSQS